MCHQIQYSTRQAMYVRCNNVARSCHHCCSGKETSLRYPATNGHATYCHLSPAPLYYIFPNFLINGTIFERNFLNKKCGFWFSLQLLYQTFLILRRNERDMIKGIHWSSCKSSVILVGFSRKMNFLNRFSKNSQVTNFMKIRSVWSEVLPYEGKDSRRDTWRS